jgi:hypothetical protein
LVLRRNKFSATHRFIRKSRQEMVCLSASQTGVYVIKTELQESGSDNINNRENSLLKCKDNTLNCIKILNIIKLFRYFNITTQTSIRMFYSVCCWNSVFQNALMQKESRVQDNTHV